MHMNIIGILVVCINIKYLSHRKKYVLDVYNCYNRITYIRNNYCKFDMYV